MNNSSLKVLFHTKAREVWECPMKYYWRNHEHLTPKTRNPNMERGSYVHEVMNRGLSTRLDEPTINPEHALAIAFGESQEGYFMTSDVKSDADSMALFLWNKLQEYQVVSSEKLFEMKLSDGYTWRAKLDSILEVGGRKWQGEYKTTAQYASNLKRLYHSGIQPFLYLYVAKECGEELAGTKMFIATKKGCEVEEVIATEEQYEMARRFIYETHDYVVLLEKLGYFPKNRTACVQLISECPYRSLCVEKASKTYVEEAIGLMYERVDPLAHYGEVV